MKRYFAANLEGGVLDAEESRHCTQVMRQAVCDTLSVFNGQGVEAKARITSIERDIVHYQILAKAVSPRAAHPLWLAQALTKPKSMDLIFQKATELGVSELLPLQSDHSVVQVGEEKVEARIEKWRRLTVEAAKQCGQNWLPVIHPPRAVRAGLLEVPRGAVKLIASLQPEARPLKTVLHEQRTALKPGTPVVIMIGPEGDFTPAEIGHARSLGFMPVSLGKIILRAETAAFFTLSALAYELMEE